MIVSKPVKVRLDGQDVEFRTLRARADPNSLRVVTATPTNGPTTVIVADGDPARDVRFYVHETGATDQRVRELVARYLLRRPAVTS